MKNKIEYFLNEFLPQITQEESLLIENALKWDGESKLAFKLAKQIFEETHKKKVKDA